jgi:hypothetical protein
MTQDGGKGCYIKVSNESSRNVQYIKYSIRRRRKGEPSRHLPPPGVLEKIKQKVCHEKEPVNRSQMDVKRKTCDIRTLKKNILFLHISSVNFDTLVPSLYQCVETLSTEVLSTVVSATSAPGRTSSATSNVLERISPPSCEQLYATDTSHSKQEIFLWISFALCPFVHKKSTA